MLQKSCRKLQNLSQLAVNLILSYFTANCEKLRRSVLRPPALLHSPPELNPIIRKPITFFFFLSRRVLSTTSEVFHSQNFAFVQLHIARDVLHFMIAGLWWSSAPYGLNPVQFPGPAQKTFSRSGQTQTESVALCEHNTKTQVRMLPV